ncbi:transcription factor LAF1-like [Rosa rugosa]|uniref:transcription factor LAF1-like n=1 Tax=Rosa rugosa TaxID=74645 RepID=UPI002B40FD37|nr:transcription factor LAF1-like [Rosa rugosa]
MDDYGASPAGSADESKSTSCPRGHWRPAEDERLRQLVEQYGAQNWNSIAEKLHGRSGKSCRLRWFNQLDPRINRRPFSEEEEERLLAAHRIHGNKWAMIARLFPGRTDNAVKNHWHVIMARRQREQSKLICGGNKRSYQDFLISSDSISNTSSSISNTFDSRKLKSSTGFDHNQNSTTTMFEFRNPGKGRAMSFMESSRPKSSSSHNWNFASMTSSLSIPNSTSSAGFLRGSEISNYKVSECLKGNSDHLFVHRINGQYSSPAFVYGRYRGSGSSSTFGLPNPRRVNVPINPFGYLSSSTSPLGDIHEQHGSRMILKKEYLTAASSTTFEDHPHPHHDSSIEHNKEVPFIDFLGVGISS